VIINGREIRDASFRVFTEAVEDAMDRLVEPRSAPASRNSTSWRDRSATALRRSPWPG
jgi:hypothetical protein